MTPSPMPPRLPITASFFWLIAAAQLIARRPGGLLLTALALVCGFGALLLLVSMLIGAGMRGDTAATQPPDLSALGSALLPLAALGLIIPQWIAGGLSAVLHTVALGDAPRLTTALTGLRRHWPALTALAVLPVALIAASLVLYRVLGGEEYLQQYLAMTQSMLAGKTPTPPQAAHPALLSFALMFVNWLIYALLLLTPAHVVVGGHGAIAAILAGSRALLRHLPAMLMGGAVGTALMMAAAMITLALLLPITAVASASPLLGTLLSLAMLAALATVWALVWSAVGYVAWRTMLGDAGGQGVVAAASDAAQGRIEV